MLGGAQVDTIQGGGGADEIYGGAGADRIEGGAGADLFRWNATHDFGSASRDQVLDFTPAEGDRIRLETFFSQTWSGRPLVFRGEIAGFVDAAGAALPGADLGPGFAQIW
ncbi:MAG: M10 family metallopeptidase C-terminal domain-containing protein, partial [bacterium]